MAKAIRYHTFGPPDVLRWEAVDVGSPGPAEVRVRHEAVGLNFADTYFRTGLYPAQLPAGMGVEAAGVIEAVGPDVRGFAEGDRVTYTGSPLGAYSTERVMPAESLIKLPEGIAFETAAAMTMRGLTAAYLLNRIYPVKRGDTVLLHAAAGGVGLIFVQWARLLGVNVIGTVSSDEKAEVARAHGCADTIVYTRENVPERVRVLTDGAGVPVVYDSVGEKTHRWSLDSPRPPRTAGLLRHLVGPDPADRRHGPGHQGIAFRHPPGAGRLHRGPGGARGARRRALRPRGIRADQDRDQPAVRARGRRAGAPGPGERAFRRVVSLLSLTQRVMEDSHAADRC